MVRLQVMSARSCVDDTDMGEVINSKYGSEPTLHEGTLYDIRQKLNKKSVQNVIRFQLYSCLPMSSTLIRIPCLSDV